MKPALRALRVLLAVLLGGTVFVQILMLFASSDQQEKARPIGILRALMVVGLIAVQVGLVCLWKLASMLAKGQPSLRLAVRYIDRLIAAIGVVAVVWFLVTAANAPAQSEDPGVTGIMCGIGLGIVGMALMVFVLRQLLVQLTAQRKEGSVDQIR